MEVVYELPRASNRQTDIVRCPQCDILRVSPLPNMDDIRDFYKKKPVGDLLEKAEVFSSPIITKLKESLIISPVIKWFKSELRGKSNPKLLDIGCASVWITAVARKNGFDAMGLEANPYLSDIARKKYGLNIKEGFIEDFDCKQLFDAVSMFHVLEHLIDPLDSLSRARDILTSRGLLLTVVPNSLSLGVRIFKRYYNWNAQQHMSFFSEKSIRIAFERSGFDLISVKHLPSPPILWYSFKNLMNTKQSIYRKVGFLKNPYLFNILFTPLALYGKHTKKGEVIAVIGRKKY